jgi:hypothetical protein
MKGGRERERERERERRDDYAGGVSSPSAREGHLVERYV